MSVKYDFSIDCMFIDFGAWKCQPRCWVYLQRSKLNFNENLCLALKNTTLQCTLLLFLGSLMLLMSNCF